MKGYTDIVGGKMTMEEVAREIQELFRHRTPKRVIIDIKRKPNGYHTKIWIPIEDFHKWR